VRGKDKYAACAACHGAEGKGNPALGARDLTARGGWIYGQTVAGISETISKGRGGVMPAFKGLLSEAQLHLVASYVYSLSSPPTAAPAATATAPATK
jgi:cytochrome c oxidase cbb3-type subunit 3